MGCWTPEGIAILGGPQEDWVVGLMQNYTVDKAAHAMLEQNKSRATVYLALLESFEDGIRDITHTPTVWWDSQLQVQKAIDLHCCIHRKAITGQYNGRSSAPTVRNILAAKVHTLGFILGLSVPEEGWSALIRDDASTPPSRERKRQVGLGTLEFWDV